MTGFHTVTELLKWVNKLNNKNLFHQLLKALVAAGCWEIWLSRNSIVFDGKLIPMEVCIAKIRASIRRCAFLFNGAIANNVRETMILRFFGIDPKYKGSCRVIEVI